MMKKLAASVLGLSFVLGTAAFAQDAGKSDTTTKKTKKHKKKKADSTDASKASK